LSQHSLINCNALTLRRANVMYTPIIKERFYNVLIEDIQVNGVSLGLDPSIYNTK